MLFSILLNFLKVLIIAVLSKPGDDILVRPVDLESMSVIVVDVIL